MSEYGQGWGGDAVETAAPEVTLRVTAPTPDYSQAWGGDVAAPSPAMQTTPSPVGEWSDYPKYAGSELARMRAGLTSAMGDEAAAKTARDTQQAYIESMSPAGRTAAEAPVLSGETLAHPGRALAYGAESLGLNVAPYAAATTMGGPGAAAAYGFIQGYGDARNQVHEAVNNAPESKLEAFDPDFAMVRQHLPDDQARTWLADKVLSTTHADLWSGVATAIMGGAGGVEFTGVAGKIGLTEAETAALKGTRVEQLVKGAGRGALELGPSGAVTYGVTGHAIAQAGAGEEPTGSEILGAGASQAVFGAAMSGAMAFAHAGSKRNLTQTGGETHVERTDVATKQTEAKPRAATAADPAAITPPPPPASPVGPAEAQALKGEPVTPRVEPQPTPVVQPTEVAQPPGEIAQEPQRAPPVGQEPSGLVPPPPPPEPQPAPAPAPPAPVDPAVLAQQRAELLDPAHPRDAMIVPKGVQVPDITTDKWRYGKVVLPNDGRTVVYDHSRGSGWRKDAIKAAAKDGTLEGKIEAQAAQAKQPESVAGAEPAAVEEPQAPAAAAAAPQPTEIQKPSVESTLRVESIEPTPPAERRVLVDVSEAGKAAQEKQTQAVEKNLAALATEKEEPVSAGKHRGKAEQTKLANDRIAADRIISEHPAGPYSDVNATYRRAVAMVEAAKKAAIKIPSDFREGHPYNASMLKLREAADLIRKKFPTHEEFGRFMTREHLIDTGKGEEAFAERRAEGAAMMGAPEGAVETRPGEHEAREISPEEETIRKEEGVKEPGGKREETALQKQAREASERARAKLAEREAPRERPTLESKGEEEPAYRTPKAVAGFQRVEMKKRVITKPTHADMQERPREQVKTQTFREGRSLDVAPLRSSTVKEVIPKHLDLSRYSKELRPMIERLTDAVTRIAGDTPVHYLSDAEMNKISPRLRGSYDARNGQIFLNEDRLNHETPLHEAFHAATVKAIHENPQLASLMDRLRKEMQDAYDNDKSRIPIDIAAKIEQNAFKNPTEFLTYLMTNEKIQDYFKGFKISDELSRDIGIPRWRKSTLWNGVVEVLRQGINKLLGREAIGPRDTSAIEAAMAVSEHLFMAKDPRFAIEAATRLAKTLPTHHFDVAERDQEAVIRSPKEAFARVKDIDKTMVKEFTKDKLTNLGGALMKGSAKVLSGTWLDDVHGHLFKDAKGPILQAINDARNRVSHQYNQLMRKDIDHINKGYMLDKTHASQMADYSKLMDMSQRYNIRADQSAPKPSKAGKHVQRDKFGPEARATYDRLHADLQKRYTEDIKYYRDSQAEQAQSVLDNNLPLFDPPKGSTLEEVMKRARDNDLTDDDWAHYEDLGVAGPLREASRLASRQEVYANTQRDGRWAVTGRYEMPKGGKDISYSGSELPDNVREFDTEQQAHAYMADTRMKATVREAYYVKDNAGKYTDVYPSTPETEKAGIVGKRVRSADAEVTKHRVSLERQNYQLADSRAEAERNRQAMEADGVKELSGVMDKRDEKAWSTLNSADQNLLERKIDSRKDLTDVERQHMKDVTRQMMLSSRGGMSPHMIQARKVAGAKFDSAAGLHDYARAANFHMARQAHAAELSDAMSRLDAHEKAMRATDPDNATRRSIVANEYHNRVYGANANALSSSVSPFVHKLMTWAFINFLARPSHIILSQLHPYIYSVPMIAAKHGYWKALQGQRQAMRDLGGMGHNLMEGLKAGMDVYKSGGEQNIDKAVAMARGVDPILRMINGLKDKGERDALMRMWETEHLHSAFDASVFAGSGMDRTNAIVRQFTDAMEANNRLSTALNAYRLEKAMHKDPANALAYSRRVIEQTHGVFSSTNTASVFKNPIMKGVMQFRQQPMNLAIMMYRNMAKAATGDNEARWTLAYQLGTAAALGGMGGMPMDLPKLVGLAGQAAGGPSPADWDDKFYRTLVDNLGETAAKAIHDGLPGMMGPYGPSLGHRTGFDAGFLFGEPKSDTADDMLSYTAKSLAGASVGMGMDWVTAAHNAMQGDWERAGEGILPGSLKDMLKTYRNATQGVTAGKQQIAPPSVGEELLQMLGFSGVERERQMAGHFALQKELRAEQAAARETVGAKLKAAQQAHKQKTVLGVRVGKKQAATAREYQHAYQ